ncbi:MAG: hypothetical protein NT062_32585 [Proteobacteria bacterium]|nr:hypothetical protein [Pseudomonadota bacterium]
MIDVRRRIDLRDLDPDVGGPGLGPALELVGEGGAVGIDEVEVVAVVGGHRVVDVHAVLQRDEDREVDERLGARGVRERQLAAIDARTDVARGVRRCVGCRRGVAGIRSAIAADRRVRRRLPTEATARREHDADGHRQSAHRVILSNFVRTLGRAFVP